MIKVNARKAKWEEFIRKLSGVWGKVRPKKVCKVVNSVYFRIFWGKLEFTNIVFLEMWGQPLEWSVKARGKTVGHHAYGCWQGAYGGEDLYSWCYEGSWGYVDER